MRRKRPYNLKDDYDALPKKVRDCVKQLNLVPGDAGWFDIYPADPETMCIRLLAVDALLCTGDNLSPPSTRWPNGKSKLEEIERILKGDDNE